MVLLRDYFDALDDEHASERTGFNAWELYAAKPTDLWMSPSHTGKPEGVVDDGDEWKAGAFRIDPFWFGGNAGDPIAFYKPLWELFESSDIPFRLHWGKYQPASDAWTAYFRLQYPRWDQFLKVRNVRDPAGTFGTDYWGERLR
jgi:D-arabinono-1,4-lactone oxidase